MRILGIESASLVASVAILTDDEITAEYTVNFKKTHSQTLLPMIDEISKVIELDLDTIDAIAVSGGPGSFTGLRIGSATAKGLGLALDKPLINVKTIDAMAYQCFSSKYLICPIMDARRNQVYTGIYYFENDRFITLMEQCAVDMNELISKLNCQNKEVIFLGDGVLVQKNNIENNITVPYCFAPSFMARARAASVAELGRHYYIEGKMENARDHKPNYLKVSQAERELQERQK